MNWLRLTAPSGAALVVNFNLVQWFEASQAVPKAQTVLLVAGDYDTSLYVQETIEQIAFMLPFSAQPVPGNYRANPDG